MRIGVLMYYDNAIREYGDITYKINKNYCNKYNLDLILSNEKMYNDRHPAWERLPLILKHIKNYDYIIWIDADAFFYTDSNNIVDIINKNINVNFIFSKDLGNTNINTGFFIVKNTQYSIDFINKWAYDEELYKNNPIQCWWDQGVFVDMYNKNILDIQNNQISYDYGVLQHFDFNELSQFQDKPFIFHLASKSNLNRKIICTNYYNVFIKNSFD